MELRGHRCAVAARAEGVGEGRRHPRLDLSALREVSMKSAQVAGSYTFRSFPADGTEDAAAVERRAPGRGAATMENHAGMVLRKLALTRPVPAITCGSRHWRLQRDDPEDCEHPLRYALCARLRGRRSRSSLPITLYLKNKNMFLMMVTMLQE